MSREIDIADELSSYFFEFSLGGRSCLGTLLDSCDISIMGISHRIIAAQAERQLKSEPGLHIMHENSI